MPHPWIKAARKILETAIAGQKKIEAKCRSSKRTVEPYILFEGRNGRMSLYGWQSGATDPDVAGFLYLPLDEILEISMLEDRFIEPRDGYDAGQSRFFRLLAEIPTGKLVPRKRPCWDMSAEL